MDTEQQYIKGFNNGYLLAEHEPGLLQKVAANLQPVNDYIDGFLSGKEQFELDRERIQLEELSRLRNNSKEQGLELE